MRTKVLDILKVRLRVDIEVELEEEEHITFEDIEFCQRDASDPGVEDVVIVAVLREFDGQQDGGDQESVDAMDVQLEGRILLEQSVDVDEGNDAAAFGAVGELLYSRHIVRH